MSVLLLQSGASRRERLLGLLLMFASAGLWFVEMKIISHFQPTAELHPYWTIFQNLGDSKEAVLANILARPWRFAIALVWPPAKLWTLLQMSLRFALLPLAAGAQLWPAAIAILPHQLAYVKSDYHTLNAHKSAFAFGPLLWAMIFGWNNIQKKISSSQKHLIYVWTLCICGILFCTTANFLLPEGLWPRSWTTAVPKMMATIPPDAKVWGDDFLMPQLAMRRYLKRLPDALPEPMFETRLFMPDYVLFSEYWTYKADPSTRDRILTFLRHNDFVVARQEGDLVLLAKAKPANRVTWTRIP